MLLNTFNWEGALPSPAAHGVHSSQKKGRLGSALCLILSSSSTSNLPVPPATALLTVQETCACQNQQHSSWIILHWHLPPSAKVGHPATGSSCHPLCCWSSRDHQLGLALLLMAGTQPPSEHHSGVAAEHINNTAACVLVKRGNFGWEMWGAEQDAQVSSVTVSGYKHLKGNKAKVTLLRKSERKWESSTPVLLVATHPAKQALRPVQSHLQLPHRVCGGPIEKMWFYRAL